MLQYIATGCAFPGSLIIIIIILNVLSCLIATVTAVNVTITSSPKLGIGTLCQDKPVNLTCNTTHGQSGVTFNWIGSNQSVSLQGATITVVAELTRVVYTCIAISIGQASVTVMANGEPYIITVEIFITEHHDPLCRISTTC